MSDTILRQAQNQNENQRTSLFENFNLPDVVINMGTTDPKKEIAKKHTEERDDDTRLEIGDGRPNIEMKEVINNNVVVTSPSGQNEYIVMRVLDTQHKGRPHYQPEGWYGGGYGGAQDGNALNYDPATRNYFVKFVFIIVFVMLLLTAGFIAFVMATDEVKDFFNRHGMILLIPAFILFLGAQYAMYCSPCARVPPCNFICLIITVIGMSLMAAKISAHYRTEIVLYGALATTAVVFVCILLACTRFDFTSYLLYVVVIATAFSVIAMIVLATMLITGEMMKPLVIVILVVGTLIEVVMLTIELQMILGGKSVELSEDDYALGAFMLYTCIMSLFMKFVQLIGFADN